MDFVTLLAMAVSDKFAPEFCADSFRRRYAGGYIVDIDREEGANDFHIKLRDRYNNNIKDEYVRHVDFETVLKALQIFGSEIRVLKLDVRKMDPVASDKIIQTVRTYCSDSLIEIDLAAQDDEAVELSLMLPKEFKNLNYYVVTRSIGKIKGLRGPGRL